ncbi:MAG: GNAT family N-acetyltransferase [Planctomycetota bacterium]
MADELVIRELEPRDEERAVEIAVLAWEPVFVSFRELMGDSIFEAERGDWRADKAEQIRRGIANEHARFCVAEIDGVVAGFVSFHTGASGVGEIGNNAVHPDFQNRGIATRLYQHALAEMKAAGMRAAKVQTGLDRSHAPARRAYEKAGFDRAVPSVTYYRQL